MAQEVIEVTEREVEIIEVIERGPVGPTGPQPNINYEVVSNARTLEAADLIAADTSGGAFTLTLPANPNNGDAVDIFDYAETFDTNPLTIARNGQPIESLNEDLVANVEGAYFTLIYTGATRGWQVLPRYGTSGGGGESALTTQGDMLYRGVGINTRLPIGSAGQILKVNSGATAPEWGAAPATGVTSVGITGSDGIEVDSGSPVTGSGSIALGVNAATLRSHINVADGAEVNVQSNWTEADSGSDAFILNKPSTFTPSAHASSHHTSGTDELAAHQINGQTIFSAVSFTYSSDQTLAANRARQLTISNTNASGINVTLPTGTDGTLLGDTYVIIGGSNVAGPITVRRINVISPLIYETVATISSTGEQYRFRSGGGATGSWSLVPVDTHTHTASQITSGTLAHERGGLEADVSAYSGLVKIDAGTTSAVTVTAAGEALLDDADAAAQRTTLGLGNSATLDTGTTAGTVAEGNHTHADLHTRSHAITSTSDHTAGNHKVFYSDGSGQIQELALGNSGEVLTSNGASAAPSFAAASGGVTAVNSTLADILSVSGSDLVADDLGADKLYGFDDSEGKAIGFTIGSGLSVSGDTLSATATGTIGGSTSTDNAIVRADSTSNTVQDSALVIDDATTSTQANVAIVNAHSETNSALVLTPKGTGAFIVGPKPDGTSTGGNARGVGSVCMVFARNAATQIASGINSVAIGYRATASNLQSLALCANTASGAYSTAIGGLNSSATNSASTTVGGLALSASGAYAFCAGGDSNTASDSHAIAFGQLALANRRAIIAHAAGQFSAQGDAQTIRAVLRNKTTTNSAVELFTNGSSTRLTCPSGKVMAMLINITGVKSDGSAVAHYVRQYAIKNVGGTTSEVYAPVTIGTDNAASTSIALSANDTNDALKIEVTGIASETWRWVASVDAVEVAYGS